MNVATEIITKKRKPLFVEATEMVEGKAYRIHSSAGYNGGIALRYRNSMCNIDYIAVFSNNGKYDVPFVIFATEYWEAAYYKFELIEDEVRITLTPSL